MDWTLTIVVALLGLPMLGLYALVWRLYGLLALKNLTPEMLKAVLEMGEAFKALQDRVGHTEDEINVAMALAEDATRSQHDMREFINRAVVARLMGIEKNLGISRRPAPRFSDGGHA